MRAALLLLCLALSRDASASIFRTQYLPQMDLIVQPLDYIGQYQPIRQLARHSSESSSEESRQSETQGQNWDSPLYSEAGHRKPVKDKRQEERNMISWQGVRFPSANAVYSNEETEHIYDDAFKTMNHVSEETKRKIHEVFSSSHETAEDATFNATQLLQKYNYGVEEHVVSTDDGYSLTLFRINKKQEIDISSDARPAVLLVHGLLGSADDWLLMGPGKSLAYQMADASFDVWLGNVRGSKYSRRHASKHPAQSDFWQFSIDEIAAHDLPAMIDHVLEVSQQPKLYYVGHSQATTAFFAMASTFPKYREKVALMHALSPMVYMTHVRSPFFKMISPKSRYYKAVHHELGHGEFQPSKKFIREVGGKMCQDVIGCEHVCSNVNFVISGVDAAAMDVNLVPVITRHLPAGASTRHIKHYGQAHAADQLRKYDYGSHINQKVYGQPEPPKYDMTEVQVPVALYYSEEDWLAHPKDVERLHSELPDVRDYYKVPEKHFSHMDFQYSKKAPTAINQRVIDSISKSYNSLSMN